MAEKGEQYFTGKLNYYVVSRRYYVVTDSSGLPAADFYSSARGGIIVPRDRNSSGDIRI